MCGAAPLLCVSLRTFDPGMAPYLVRGAFAFILSIR